MKPIVDYIFEKTSRVVGIEDEVYKYIDDMSIVPEELINDAIARQKFDIDSEVINKQIQEAKVYLTNTGWIWEKYNRNVLVLKDMTDDEFYTKYSEIITKQEECRLLINTLEEELKGGE